MDFLYQLFLLAPAVLLGLTIHEFSHAWVAYKLGDPTAKALGRLTLNPISHLDLLGAISLLIFKLGWAKPVPYDPRYFRHPKRDTMLVAAAGPASNFVLAILLGISFRLFMLLFAKDGLSGVANITAFMLLYGVFINLTLAFFNLIPVPPLDGSKILVGFLPPALVAPYMSFAQFGPFLLFAVILFGNRLGFDLFGTTILPLAKTFSGLFAGATL